MLRRRQKAQNMYYGSGLHSIGIIKQSTCPSRAFLTNSRAYDCNVSGPFHWQLQPHVPFEFDGVELLNAGVLRGSLVPGTSILGLDLKKDVGLNETLSCSTGILQNTNVSISKVWKTDKATGNAYTGQSSGLGV
jgi:hypothetical protein